MHDPTLVMTGEGVTEERFLLPLVSRFIQEKLMPAIEVYPRLWIDLPRADDEQRISMFAQRAFDYDVAIYHFDADSQDVNAVWQRRFKVHYDKLKHQSGVHQQIVAAIPKRSTNAWMLADIEKLLDLLELKQRPPALNSLRSPADAEKLTDPKATLKAVLAAASRPRRPIAFRDVCVQLAPAISLDKLQTLPSFQFFDTKLREAVAEFND